MITWYRWLLAVVLVGVFYTNLPDYVFFNRGILVPYLWVLGFAVLALPMVIHQLLTGDIVKSPLAAWCFLYIFVTIVWFMPAQSDIAWQEVRWRALTVLELAMFLVLVTSSQMNRQIRVLLVVGVLVGVAINVYELFVPLSFSPILGRSAGFYMNPTTLL